MNIDIAKENFEVILSDIAPRIDEIRTEQDARFQLIDRFLVEVLGWNHEEISTEPHTEAGYVDYLLKHGSQNRLVIEAKKIGTNLINTKNGKMTAYKINGPALQDAEDGFEQATSYCVKTGVNYAVLTTGLTWLGFMATRGDGKNPKEGKAITFPSFGAIKTDFAIFYDIFSREGVLSKTPSNSHQST